MFKSRISRIFPLRVVKNTSLLGLANVSYQLAQLLITLMIARFLGQRELGIFALAMAYAGLAPNFAQLGLNVLVRRDVARDHALTGAYMGKLLPLMFVSISLTLLMVLGIINAVGYSVEIHRVILFIFLTRAFDTLGNLCLAVFVAHEQMQYATIMQGGGAIVSLAGGLLLLLKGSGLIYLAIWFVLVSTAKFGVQLMIVYRHFGRFRLSLDSGFWKRSLAQSLPIAVATVLAFLLLRLDTILLSIMKGESAVGLYNAAYNLFAAADIITRSFNGAVFPVLAVSYVHSVPRARTLYTRSMLLMVSLGIVLAATLFVLANPIIALLYGSAYTQSAVALRILGLSIPLFFMSRIGSASLHAMNQQVAGMFISAGVLLFNIVANILVIPRLSFVGASISTGLTYALASGIMLFYTFNLFNRSASEKS